MEKFVLAGDLGGTNLRIAAVNRAGRILARMEAETPRATDQSLIVGYVASLVEQVIENCGSNPAAFGFAVPAVLAADGQIVLSSPNLPELNGSDLAGTLRQALGLDIILENDANAAAIGENWLGASSGFTNSICVTLGTGVGGGLIINAKPFRGPDGTAGEVGHICVEPLGPPCGCGSNGCLEQFSSASAIVRMANELAPSFPATRLKAFEEFEASVVYELGVGGDPLCIEVFRRAGSYLGIALAGLVNVLNPEVIVIGGGAADGWDLFIEPARAEIRKRAFHEPAERARIVRAKLGSDAGIVGAAYLALEKSGVTRQS